MIEPSFQRLRRYCEREQFKGWDPYDGLNSRWFQRSPLRRLALAREVWIQLFKRNPVNFRRIAGVPKEHNPKGLGLFLTAYCNQYRIEPREETAVTIRYLANRLLALRTPGFSGACWGYNFPWQSLVFFQEKYAPTVVATTFIAYGLMDAYDCLGEPEYLEAAVSAAEFVRKDLNRTEKPAGIIFSYSPKDRTVIYNASLLASRMLARTYAYTRDRRLLELAGSSVAACAAAQLENGAWYQGEEINQRWTDSFHTGYNLEGIAEYMRYSGDRSYQTNLDRGWQYLVKHFFLQDGTPKYYDTRTYPIDIHAPAQFPVTTYRLGEWPRYRELAERVLQWTIRNMQDPQGFFYYQRRRVAVTRIPYMRWAQAWMLYGMSFHRLAEHEQGAGAVARLPGVVQ